jgi:phosphoribosylglycinamide formyltransferase 1
VVREVALPPKTTARAARVATAVLVSGSGTNLQAVIDAVRDGILPLDLKLVVSNKPKALALGRAVKAGIPTLVMPFNRETDKRSAYGRRLAAALREHGVRLVLLLGWMLVLPPEFLEAGFEGVLNLHPAYLPEDPNADTVTFSDGTTTPCFRGAHALRDALAAGVAVTGASLIEITPQVDRGPLLARKTMLLQPEEDEATALERLHAVERDVVREGLERWLASRLLT